MKTFLILFKTGSIPFSSNKQADYIKEWNNYINELRASERLKDCSFLKKDGAFISGKNIELRSYIPHKDIFSGFMIIKANNIKEAVEICKDCPVFERNGDIQVKEIDREYLDLK